MERRNEGGREKRRKEEKRRADVDREGRKEADVQSPWSSHFAKT